MKPLPPDTIYCEDCAFYKRPVRSGCSAPQNLKLKNYSNRTTRRTGDIYIQKWKDPEIMRLFGKFTARLFNVCGKHANWFLPASTAEIELRKLVPMKRSE